MGSGDPLGWPRWTMTGRCFYSSDKETVIPVILPNSLPSAAITPSAGTCTTPFLSKWSQARGEE